MPFKIPLYIFTEVMQAPIVDKDDTIEQKIQQNRSSYDLGVALSVIGTITVVLVVSGLIALKYNAWYVYIQ